ncbi:MAG: hypothetical protein Tsb0017_25370 [Geothermobacteraceae bacterium]
MKLRLLLLGLLLFLAVPVFAIDLPQSLLERLSPLEGVVVMQVGQDYLIDRDATQGVQAGDLFAVVQPGAPVVHPQTGEIIGKLDQTLGYLQVTRVRSGYSYATPLQGAGPFDKGLTIRRFDGIDAVVVDRRGDADTLAGRLTAGLPQFNWHGIRTELPAAEPGRIVLAFVLDASGLTVQTAAGQVLAQSPAAELGLVSKAVATAQAAPVPAAGVAPTPTASTPASTGTALIPGVSATPAAPQGGVMVVQQQRKGIWRGPSLEGEAVGLAGGDFDGDGRQEIAQLTTEALNIFQLAGGDLKAEGVVKLSRIGTPLSVDAFDITGDGRPELFLGLGIGEGRVGTRMVAWQNGRYQLQPETSLWLVRMVRRPDGSTVLAGQRAGTGASLVDGDLKVMTLQQGRLEPAGPLGAPMGMTVFNAQPFAAAEGGQLWAGITGNDHLKIYSASGEGLWEGNETVGGHRAGIERRDPDSIQGNFKETFFRSARISLGPDNTLIVPINEGQRFLTKQRNYSKSRLVAYTWDGFALREAWKTPDEQAYLADFALFDADNDGRDELVTTIVAGTKWFGLGTAHSIFQVYELP